MFLVKTEECFVLRIDSGFYEKGRCRALIRKMEFLVPLIFFRRHSVTLPEHPAEVAGGLKTAFPADLFHGFRSRGEKFLCFFQAVIQKMTDRGLIHICLKTACGFAFAYIGGSCNIFKTYPGSIVVVDEIQHFLYPDLKRVFPLFDFHRWDFS